MPRQSHVSRFLSASSISKVFMSELSRLSCLCVAFPVARVIRHQPWFEPPSGNSPPNAKLMWDLHLLCLYGEMIENMCLIKLKWMMEAISEGMWPNKFNTQRLLSMIPWEVWLTWRSNPSETWILLGNVINSQTVLGRASTAVMGQLEVKFQTSKRQKITLSCRRLGWILPHHWIKTS